MKEKIKAPTKAEYGYIESDGFDDLQSGWVVEGGEEEYFAALARWEIEQRQIPNPFGSLAV
jgi:hypothetical protein